MGKDYFNNKIKECLTAIENAENGDRNNVLFNRSLAAFGHAKRGKLNMDEIEQRLIEVGVKIGLEENEEVTGCVKGARDYITNDDGKRVQSAPKGTVAERVSERKRATDNGPITPDNGPITPSTTEDNAITRYSGKGGPTSPSTFYDSCTLEQYAEVKKLPMEFLARLHLTNMTYGNNPAVRMPYYDIDGETLLCTQYRTALLKDPESNIDNRLKFKKGDKVALYGLWQLEHIRKTGYVFLVEGPSDCHTLWHHNIPALGLPSASKWDKEWAAYIEGLDVYIWREDKAGDTMVDKIGASCHGAYVLYPPEGVKDISEAHIAGRDIDELIEEMVTTAVPFADIKAERRRRMAQDAKSKAALIFEYDDILDMMVALCSQLGLVGEIRNAKLVYLALTSRLLDEPVNIVVKGLSSSGKSYTSEQVMKLFPPDAYYLLTAGSDKSLIYGTEPLEHRFIVMYEAAGMGEFMNYIIRSLLSEGHIRYEVTVEDKSKGGFVTRLYERPGPTGLITTTTWTNLHPENETRLFSVTTDDTPEQTKAIFRSLAEQANGGRRITVDLEPWIAFQTWLALEGCNQATIPYADTLASMVNPVAVRLRRDFGKLLTLVKAHAILYQHRRERDKVGRIVATITDYAAVHDLVVDIVGEGVRAAVSDKICETVAAVEALSEGRSSATFTNKQIATAMNLDEMTVGRRVKSAIKEGYLVNDEYRERQPAKIRLGEPLPDEQLILPTPEMLQWWWGGEGCPQSENGVIALSQPPQMGNKGENYEKPDNDASVNASYRQLSLLDLKPIKTYQRRAQVTTEQLQERIRNRHQQNNLPKME
jgi:hypothetical protein